MLYQKNCRMHYKKSFLPQRLGLMVVVEGASSAVNFSARPWPMENFFSGFAALYYDRIAKNMEEARLVRARSKIFISSCNVDSPKSFEVCVGPGRQCL